MPAPPARSEAERPAAAPAEEPVAENVFRIAAA
jgi:hypothetical protein